MAKDFFAPNQKKDARKGVVEKQQCLSTSFLDPVFGAMMKQACRQTLKSLAAECLVGVRLGLLNFLTPVCVD